jgi:hypothetical protein
MPFITTGVIAGAALGAALGSGIGYTAAGLAIGAIVGGGMGVGAMALSGGFSNQKQLEYNPTLPAMQSIQEIETDERRKANLMRAQKSDTILTSPLGDKTDPNTKKVILGQ